MMQYQQNGLSAMLGDWFIPTVADQPPAAYMRAEEPLPDVYDEWTGEDLDWRWSYHGDERLIVDDFEGANSPATNDLGGTNTYDGQWFEVTHCFQESCDPAFDHLKWGMRLLWQTGNVPVATYGLEGVDASGADFLSFRVVSRFSTLNQGLETQDFIIRVRDTDGVEVEALLSDFKTVSHIYPGNQIREILETVRIPLTALGDPDPMLDLAALDAIEFEMTALDHDGSVIVTDFEIGS